MSVVNVDLIVDVPIGFEFVRMSNQVIPGEYYINPCGEVLRTSITINTPHIWQVVLRKVKPRKVQINLRYDGFRRCRTGEYYIPDAGDPVFHSCSVGTRDKFDVYVIDNVTKEYL